MPAKTAHPAIPPSRLIAYRWARVQGRFLSLALQIQFSRGDPGRDQTLSLPSLPRPFKDYTTKHKVHCRSPHSLFVLPVSPPHNTHTPGTMSPLIATIDPNDDGVFGTTAPTTTHKTTTTGGQRALLLAPPSLASHANALATVLTQYDRSITDLQMLDRLAAGLVQLPSAQYDLILVLSDAAATLTESLGLLNRTVVGAVTEALKPKGQLRAENTAENLETTALAKEAVLAGLVGSGAGGFSKPDYGENDGAVSLKLGFRKKKAADAPVAAPAVGSTALNGHANGAATKPAVPAGVGFDFGDDLDDDIIDEETLMTEEDLKRPINVRTYCPSLILNLPHFFTDRNTSHSSRVPAQARQASPRLQGLHVRPGRATRGRGRQQARRGRQDAGQLQARRRRPHRGGFHRPG